MGLAFYGLITYSKSTLKEDDALIVHDHALCDMGLFCLLQMLHILRCNLSCGGHRIAVEAL